MREASDSEKIDNLIEDNERIKEELYNILQIVTHTLARLDEVETNHQSLKEWAALQSPPTEEHIDEEV